MATQQQTIASFDDGAVVVVVEYDDTTNTITAVSATVGSGTLAATITRPNGQTRSYTLTAGTSRTTNIPAGMAIGFDPDTGAVSVTRGTIATLLSWTP